MPDTVLVTGGAGFIGSHLVDRLLELGRCVVCLDDFNDHYNPALKRANVVGHLDHERYELAEGDVRDAALLDEVFSGHDFGAVVHLASRAGVRLSVRSPQVYQDVNCSGTVNLLEMCRRHGVERFVLASTSSVYGESRLVPFSVEGPLGLPKSPYAATKRYAELICRAYHERFGLKVAILRFFTVYGPRGRPDMSIRIFTDRVLRGERLPLFGDGSFERDFTYVSDIISGVVSALDLESGFEVFNLGDSSPVTMKRVIELIERHVGAKARIRRLPIAAGDIARTCADIGKSTRVLGYSPQVMIDEGIRRFVEWFTSVK